ncbi:hypothetical protein PJK54_17605 [Cobetia sp. MMG027]|uniref:hypothetical protein n=1 Tax=Cobetia sp. MMG027 TaxID=3021980 RepID=UPI0022FF3398|nr:hypothetical protein [Cobetia sp. MMG027]MDA5565472.1 hypothetical protein [Cobetia sp. MMG027]
MRGQGLFKSLSLFETGLSAAEWAWRILSFLVIGGSGISTALVAKADSLIGQLGPIYWISVGLATSLIVSFFIYLIKLSSLKQSEADLNRILSSPRDSINPLSDNFRDTIIPVEDLRLPVIQLHENKHFRRCSFVGPAAIAIIGGNYVNTGFLECGDIIALPEDAMLTGIVVLKNCTVEDCKFIKTSIFTDQNTAKGFAKVPNSSVKGIIQEAEAS